MGKNVFIPKEGDWLTNGYEAYVVVDITGGNLVANTYNLKLKSVRTGSLFDVCNAEQADDNSIIWSFSCKTGQDKPVEPDPKIAPMIEWSDDDILDYIIRKLARFTRLHAETEYWYTQAVCSTNEVEKRRAEAFHQLLLIDSIKERGKTRNGLLTNEKLGLLPNNRFTYLWNKATCVVTGYAIHRAENMRESNGIAASSGLVEYEFFEEEDTE